MLVTGANRYASKSIFLAKRAETDSVPSTLSGLGFAICCRLIDEFLSTRPPSASLHLIFTTRSPQKGQHTLSRLRRHLTRHPPSSRARIALEPAQLNLLSLRSVRALSHQLPKCIPKLDAMVLNAGIGGFTDIDWPRTVWDVLTNFPFAVTYPAFKLSPIGLVSPPQSASDGNISEPITPNVGEEESADPPLAEIFTANVFGHYMLTHFLAPLLSVAHPFPARIIWISSLEAYARALVLDDMQGFSSPSAYESSKRLTDILALTSALPSTHPFVSRFLSPPSPSPKPQLPTSPTNLPLQDQQQQPIMYLSHPGVCATSILPLPFILALLMKITFYFARWVGSPWHTIQPYKGACASVWLALASQEELDASENPTHNQRAGPNATDGVSQGQGKIKWGSCTDWWGRERARKTEVEGYDLGTAAETKREDEKVAFEELGRACWMQMETLREEWEARIQDAENA